MLDRVLQSVFPVRRGERLPVALMFFYSLSVVGGGFVIGRTLANTLFLANFDKSRLPWTNVGLGVSVSCFVWLYIKLADGLRRDRAILLTSCLWAGTALLWWIAIHWELLPAGWIAGGVYVWVEIAGTLGIIQFWAFANDCFTSREAKRLFGLIAAGGGAANLLLGFLLSRWRNADLLLWVCAGLWLSCALCAWLTGRQFAGRLQELQRRNRLSARVDDSRGRWLGDFRRIFKARHLVCIAALLCVATFVNQLVDYQWKSSLQATYGDDRDRMNQFQGWLNIVVGVAGPVFQFLLTSQVLRRAGILAGLLVLPLATSGWSLGILLATGSRSLLWAAAGAKSSDMILRYNVHETTVQLLYVPTASDFRHRAKALIEGVLKPICIMFSGFALLGLQRFLSPQQLSWVVLPALGLWLALAFVARKSYIRALGQSLSQRGFDLQHSRVSLDAAGTGVLRAALSGNDEARALYALELLCELPPEERRRALLPGLGSPLEAVRARVLVCLSAVARPEDEALFHQRLRDPSAEVRAAAMDALAWMGRLPAEGQIAELFADPSPEVRRAAAAGLLKLGAPHAAKLAARQVGMLVSDDDPAARIAGARLIAALQTPTLADVLERLLRDADGSVRLVAIRLAGELQWPQLAAALIEAALAAETSAVAAGALARLGDAALGPLCVALRQAVLTAPGRQALHKVIQTIGTPAAVAVLSTELKAEDREVSGSALAALAALVEGGRRQGLELALDVHWRRETQDYFQTCAILEELRAHAAGPLGDALRRRLERQRQRLLCLLALQYPGGGLARLDRQLAASSPQVRANALELLDQTCRGEFRRLALRVWDDSASRPPGWPEACCPGLEHRTPLEWLVRLLDDPEPWIVACTLHQIGLHQIAAQLPLVQRLAAAHPTDTLIHQAARWCVERLVPEETRAFRFDPQTGEAMMPKLEKALFLRTIPLFQDTPGEVLLRIADVARDETLPAGAHVVTQGELGDCLYLIVQGEVRVHIDGEEVAWLGPGECVGELSVLDSSPRSATVSAVTDVQLLSISQEDFFQVLAERPEVARSVIHLLCQRLREANQR